MPIAIGIAKQWGLNLISLQAKQSVADQESAFGILNQTDPIAVLRLAQGCATDARTGNHTIFGLPVCGVTSRRRERIFASWNRMYCRQEKPC